MSETNPHPSTLDPAQIVKQAYDENLQRLRVDAEVTATIVGPQEVIISQVDDSILVYGNDGATNRAVKTDASGNVQTNVLSSALPAGAATSTNQTSELTKLDTLHTDLGVVEGKQDTGNTSLASIDGKTPTLVAGRVPVDGSGVTQPVSGTVAVSNFPASQNVVVTSIPEVEIKNDSGNPIPVNGTVAATQSGTWNVTNVSGTVSLPTGAATSALQTTGNSSLSSLDSKTTVVNTGAVTISTALPAGTSLIGKVGIDQTTPGTTNKVSIGTDGVVAATQSGTWTVQPGNTANTTAWKVDGSAVTQPISGTVTSNAGTNLNTSALALSATQTDRTQKSQITDGTRDGTVKSASTAAVATDTALVVAISPNNTVAATQSGTWNVTNVSGTVSLPTGASTAAKQPALGTAGTASSDVITIQGVASMTAVKVDGSAVTQPVSIATQSSSTSALSNVVSSASSVSLLSSNSNRVGVYLFNDSTSYTYVAFAATSSTTSFTFKLAPGGLYEAVAPIWKGALAAIWDSANGSMRVTEIT